MVGHLFLRRLGAGLPRPPPGATLRGHVRVGACGVRARRAAGHTRPVPRPSVVTRDEIGELRRLANDRFAAAEASSTSAAFCCVTLSIYMTALLTWSMPPACSCAAAAISATMSVTLLDRADDIPRTWPDCVTSLEPCSTLATLSWIRPLISFAAVALRAARFAPPGHDREAAALLAGARRLDRGVEGQEVGLECDLVDDADDVGDLAAGRLIPVMAATASATTGRPFRLDAGRVAS